jgi:hypothetical protein
MIGFLNRSMTPTGVTAPQKTMFQKLDFYGRKKGTDEYEGTRHASIEHIPNHLQDTIELELRSQLDMAKSDLS